MINALITVDKKYIAKHKAAEFDFDVRRWKSVLKHLENELVFINRILTSEDFNAKTENLTERLNTFKKQIKTKTEILKGFEIEVAQYNHELVALEHSDIDITDSTWLEKHGFLKHRLEDFCKDFNAFKLKVLKYT